MLTWLVDAKVVDVVLKTPGKLVEEDVEVRPEKLPDGILDENIDNILFADTSLMMHG